MLSTLLMALVLAAQDGGCSDQQVGPIGSASDDLARVAELTGAAPVKSQLFRRWSDAPTVTICEGERAPHPSKIATAPLPERVEAQPLPFTWRTYLETGYPDDRNDGALWRGRGISTEATGGVRLRWKWFSAAAAPVVAWQQNRDFARPDNTQPGYSPFANPFNNGQIDLPLRFGPSDFWTFDPGQSYARVDIFNVGLGFSTENLWWGPGIRNSIIMSNSAPGMPHLFLGTSKPQDIYIGWLEAQLVWGWPSQSKWFYADGRSDDRLFTSLTVGYEPKWVPGLFVGVARVFLDVIPPGGLPFSYYFGRQFPFGTGTNGTENQLASLFARWVFPEAGLEIYGEWGKDDYWGNFKDLVTQPEHDAAYMAGFQKIFSIGSNWLRLHAELTNTLSKPTAIEPAGRGTPIFYTHSPEIQGYTVGGQMLGAGIGPQANTQFLALDYFHERGRIGAWFERVLRNGSYFWRNVGNLEGEDAEVIAGLRGVWSWKEIDVDASAAYAYRYNMNFLDETSAFKGMLALTWWPGRKQPIRLPSPLAHTSHPGS